jgi:glycosyltransferase involved in cell wall biosynthesis
MFNVFSPVNNLGYGVAGYNIVKNLFLKDVRTTLYPIGNPEVVGNMQEVVSAINNQVNHIPQFPCLKIWHQNDLFSRVGNGKFIGFPIFELTEFDIKEKYSLKHCDEIVVCSKWAKEVILNNNIGFNESNVHVAPLGVDREIFSEAKYQTSRPTTIFLNCGKWEKRKGHDVLLECFNLAFEDNDNVELWMIPTNPFIGDLNNQWENVYKSSKLGDKIRIIPRQESQIDIFRIMSQADCGVFPSRAEGWNLELLEMMSCGKNVITTKYSAHTEFCDDNNSRLIEIDNLETAVDGVFFHGKCGLWAEFSEQQKEQLINHMRAIHAEKQQGSLKLNEPGIETAKMFSWDNCVKEIINVA